MHKSLRYNLEAGPICKRLLAGAVSVVGVAAGVDTLGAAAAAEDVATNGDPGCFWNSKFGKKIQFRTGFLTRLLYVCALAVVAGNRNYQKTEIFSPHSYC